MFSPGETITHSFFVPFKPDDIAKVIVTYKQRDHIVLEITRTTGFQPVTEPIDPDPAGDIFVVISGAEVQGTKLVINPSIGPQPIPSEKIIGSDFNIHLSQQESLLFNTGIYEAQVNVLTTTGDRYTSEGMKGDVGVQHVRMVMTVG